MQYNPRVLYDLNEFYDEVSKTSVEYQYDPVWKDKLIKYNGKTITYDGNGNPTNYMGIPMSWDVIHGTLTSVKKNNTNIRYGYTSDGQRLTKEVAGKKTTYVYNAGMLLSEVTDTDRINFYYDSDGVITQVGYQKKNGSSFGTESFYFFTRNGQGDVVGVYEGNKSTLVGTYEYDLWGKVAAVTKASSTSDPDNFLNRNPIRYRSYYYDNETGFYYLNARYYDPIVHRFISPEPNFRFGEFDKEAGLSAYNVYLYCANNPVNFCDQTGEFIITTCVICCIAGAAIGATVGGIIGNVYAEKKGYVGWDKAKCIIAGAGIGGLAGGLLGYVVAPSIVGLTGVYGLSISATGIELLNSNPDLGSKIEFLMGNATGAIHNIQRSLSMERTLNKIGIYDNPEGRKLVYEAFYKAYGLIGQGEVNLENGRISVSTLLWGPYGAANLKTIWEEGKLITVYLYK